MQHILDKATKAIYTLHCKETRAAGELRIQVPGGEREFFVYFDESEAIEIDQILGGNEAENE